MAENQLGMPYREHCTPTIAYKFSGECGHFPGDSLFSHRLNLNIFKKTDLIWSIFPDNSRMEGDINRNKTGQFKCVEIKQHDLQQPVDQIRIQKGN
jgi:hypothetical protein